MDRRLAGALLLVAVLTLALVVPAVEGRRSAGTAEMVRLPAAPQVGDCVLPRASDPTPKARTTADGLAPAFTDCAGQSAAADGDVIVGEVAAVDLDSDSDAAGAEPLPAADVPGDGSGCRRSVLRFSGAELQDGRTLAAELFPTDPIGWHLTLNMQAGWLAPSPLLRSAGQRWRACVAAPLGGQGYVGRLASAFTGGRLPNEFGLCSADKRPSVLLEPIPCAEPHFAELVATATVPGGGRTAVDDIKESCVRIAGAVLGRVDRIGSGQLSADASISPAAAQFLALPQPLEVTCYLWSPGLPLSGTLVGLGDRPIPFAR